jgi:hypothetical protein
MFILLSVEAVKESELIGFSKPTTARTFLKLPAKCG